MIKASQYKPVFRVTAYKDGCLYDIEVIGLDGLNEIWFDDDELIAVEKL